MSEDFYGRRRSLLLQPASSARHAGDAPCDSRRLYRARIPRSRRPDELRHEPHRGVSPHRRLYRPHPQGRQAGRPAGGAVDQVRFHHQSDHSQDARPRRAADTARARRRGDRMRRREFITLLGGAAAAWPLAARAQQNEQIRHIGVLGGLAEDDPEMRARLAAFRQELEKRGWLEGRNVRIDTRFAPGGGMDQTGALAKELLATQPAVVVAMATPATTAVQRAANVIPIVFVNVADPVGSGFVDSLARPGRNLTGLLLFESGIVGKWLAMLKEVAPRLRRAALVFNPKT